MPRSRPFRDGYGREFVYDRNRPESPNPELYRKLIEAAESHPSSISYLCSRVAAELTHRQMVRNGVRPAPYERRRRLEMFGDDRYPPHDDHGVMLIDSAGTVGYLSEPYGFNTRDIVEFCDKHNLDHLIYGFYSTWYTGGTTPILYTKRGERFSLHRS